MGRVTYGTVVIGGTAVAWWRFPPGAKQLQVPGAE
jgi:hypothetical protein